MKTIKRTLLVSLVPLLAPMTALAQSGQAGRTNANRANTESTQADRTNADHANTAQKREGSATSWRASHVIGKDVKNAGSESIGEVEDLVVDMENGEVIAVIVSTGGFLGIGDSLSAVPVAVLRYDQQAEGFKTKLTKEQLGRAPQFKADAWPDYSNTTSSEALRSFRASLDGDATTQNTTTQNSGNTAHDADNTAQNDRANRKDFVSPTDQGNSPKDIKITKDIRSEIMDKDVSSNAKNIKIITRNERVTLNGVVDSDAEHQAILKIASNHSDQSRIIDNLTVKND